MTGKRTLKEHNDFHCPEPAYHFFIHMGVLYIPVFILLICTEPAFNMSLAV